MNKRHVRRLVFYLVTFIVLSMFFPFYRSYTKGYYKELSNEDKELLVEKAYQNMAWGFQYHGKAIFNDGTIYEWDVEKAKNKYDAKNYEEKKMWILENGTKSIKKVNRNYLVGIKNNIKEIKGIIERKNTANDAGSYYIAVYRDGEMITIRERGDHFGADSSSSAQAIIRYADEYLK